MGGSMTGTQDQCKMALVHVERILRVKADLLNKPSKHRKTPRHVCSDLLQWHTLKKLLQETCIIFLHQILMQVLVQEIFSLHGIELQSVQCKKFVPYMKNVYKKECHIGHARFLSMWLWHPYRCVGFRAFCTFFDSSFIYSLFIYL